jgi:hypothetical protein
MCIIKQNTEPCTHASCIAFYRASNLSMKMSASAEQCLMQQLQQSYATEVCRHYVNLLETLFQTPQVPPVTQMAAQLPKPMASKPLFTVPSYPLSQLYLSIESEIPEPAYKERGFSLALTLRDAQGNAVTPPSQLYFKLSVCTQEDNFVELSHNISGKRILRGTVEERVNRDGTLVFPNVVITEVSSRHIGGSFSLVVTPSMGAPVRTLVIPKVTVKARRAEKSK